MDCDNKALKHQQFANCIVVCVKSFVHKFQKDFILNVEQLSAYAITYTCRGQVGFYKLEIHFLGPMQLITRLSLTNVLNHQQLPLWTMQSDFNL